MFKVLDKVLEEELRKYDEDFWIEFMISKRWKYIVGEFSKRSFFHRFSAGTLYIKVYDSTLRSTLDFIKKIIIDKANEVLGERYVKDVKFILSEKPIMTFRRLSKK